MVLNYMERMDDRMYLYSLIVGKNPKDDPYFSDYFRAPAARMKLDELTEDDIEQFKHARSYLRNNDGKHKQPGSCRTFTGK